MSFATTTLSRSFASSLRSRRSVVVRATTVAVLPRRGRHRGASSASASSSRTAARRTRFVVGGRRRFGDDAKTSSSSSSEGPVVEIEQRGEEEEEKKGDKTADEMGLDVTEYARKIDMNMPDLGCGGGRVSRWYKSTGHVVEKGDLLCDVETNAFTFGMESEDDEATIMGEIRVPEGEEELVSPGTTLCTILHKGPPEDDQR